MPQPSEIDDAAEIMEARDAAARARMDLEALRLTIAAALVKAMRDDETPLGLVFTQLAECPIGDQWDWQQWLESTARLDACAIGKHVMQLLGTCSMQACPAADNAML
jgi:hypothetical protein